MQSIITSYLLQNKECVLPQIGTLTIKSSNAITDLVNKQILPPKTEIFFSERNNSNPDGLIKYLADIKHISFAEAEQLLNSFCNDWKEKIFAGEELKLETIGVIKKDYNGKIFFEKEINALRLKPINLKEIYQSEDKIEEEKIITLEKNNDLYKVPQTRRWYWVICAALLAAVAFGIIIFYFLDHNTTSTAGNQNSFTIDSASATYSVSHK